MITVTSATYRPKYKIYFVFSDGKTSTMNLQDFLCAEHQNPMNTKYRDVTKFKKFRIPDGKSIEWGRHCEMCFGWETIRKGGMVQPLTDRQRALLKRRFAR